MKIYIPMRYARNEYGKAIRKEYERGNKAATWAEIRSLEPRKNNIVNTITTVQKDNLILEIIKADKHKTSDKIIKFGNLRNGTPKMQDPSSSRVYRKLGVCPTILAKDYKEPKMILETITMTKYRIRKLTPRECWRLMGFYDKDFDAAAAVNSNTQLYAQAGNSIVVKVLEEIFKQIIPKNDDVTDLIIDDTYGYGGVRAYKNYVPTPRSERQGLKVIEEVNDEQRTF